MGKKKIIKQTTEEVLKEGQAIEKAMEKSQSVKNKGGMEKAIVYINSSYNNTLIALCDLQGNVLANKTAGSIGFKGAKEATSYAASKVAEAIAEIIQKLKIDRVEVIIKGVGKGRESAVRSLAARGIEIEKIRDKTPLPHGGVRPPKPRRV
jgi:small subunit ribosomal protein S11